MKNLKAAALVYGPQIHHLDHLVPFSELMGIPLLVTEEEVAAAAKKCYPSLEVLLADYATIADRLVSEFQCIFCSIPRPLFDDLFFIAQTLLNKPVRTIWCPHGNSDKGEKKPHLEALSEEETALIYGHKMEEFLKRKGVYGKIGRCIQTGNLRHQYYLKHRSFLDSLADTQVFKKVPRRELTLLYAPTWQDAEESCSFFEAIPHLAAHLPQEWNLIIKPHPNLLLKEPFRIEEWIYRCAMRPNILFIDPFPPIYPLLSQVDVYLGDMSSIGYDFLAFNRPMFFLNHNQRKDPGLYLYQCGHVIDPRDFPHIYTLIKQALPQDKLRFSEVRKKAYNYTFGEEKKWDELRSQILWSLSTQAL